MSTENKTYALAIHGGAGANPAKNYDVTEDHMADLIREGEEALLAGESALDVVEKMVMALESSGLYVAGRGSAPNEAGYVEMDASIMEGGQDGSGLRRAGSVAAVQDLISPISAARLVMEDTPHVMLAGSGANNFAREKGLEFVKDPDNYYMVPVGVNKEDLTNADLAHGTVGAVALDIHGRMAAATSTGGTFGKREGRVGDTPLPGSGTWADQNVAVSCTGYGEYFILAGGAQDVASRVRYAGNDLQQAVEGMLDDVKNLGGDGGVISLDRTGKIVTHYNSDGMKQAYVGSAYPATVFTFKS